ncbi:hypothetical protein [Epilithonimonas tenax]|uniref:hypothetical protein n=1 Tax=Epilithonimonas tenax TaxID=191577 RepID=UPI00041CA149|nr:hypothetical protein [Epilithonimonas tenax]
MKTTNLITNLLDETIILEKIAQDLEFPFNKILEMKAKQINSNLIEILINPYTKSPKMEAIQIINNLQDEMAIVELISKDLPFPYAEIMHHKIKKINSFLTKVNSIETERNGIDLQNYASDLLTELEAQQFEESEDSENVIVENFNGKNIETKVLGTVKP